MITFEAMKKNYKKHKEEISNSGYRFAVVYWDKIDYCNTLASVYKKHPILSPQKNYLDFDGPHPLLIDIGKETNSLEYRKECLHKRTEENRKLLEKLIFESENIHTEELKIELEMVK